MGMWSIRAAYFFLFFLSSIVSERLRCCAFINEEGSVHSRFRKGVEDDGKVVALTIQGATQRQFLQARNQHDQPSLIHKSGEKTRFDPSSMSAGFESKTSVSSLGRPELEAACEDFINVIGISSDCTLFKGTLSTGVEIAVVSTIVNSSKDWSDRSKEQFRNKMSVLSRVNHNNFMNLLGYCVCDE